MKFAPGLIFALLLLTCLNFSRCRNSDSGLVDTVACPIDKSVNEFITADAYYQSKVRLKTQILYRATELKRKWLKRRRPTALYKAFVRELSEVLGSAEPRNPLRRHDRKKVELMP